jgi:predicted MFS family arabinose efflux permease
MWGRPRDPDRLTWRQRLTQTTGKLAARGALTAVASPLGSALGGPLTAWLGAEDTLLVSAVATIATGLAAMAIVRLRTALAGRS